MNQSKTNSTATNAAHLSRPMLTVTTSAVARALSPLEIFDVCDDLRAKMKTPDPDNPNLWITTITGRKIWGILDEQAGPNGEDVFTILFPEDY